VFPEPTDIASHIATRQGTDTQPPAGARSPSEQVRELASIPPGATTEELLLRLLSALAAILGVRRAYVTENDDSGMARTIASWEDGRPGPVREYALSGTPCAAVMSHGVQVVDCELADRYTLAESSLGYGCESFVGSPIVNREGRKIGQVCVFGGRPLQDPEMASALVSLAAVRVSAEMEHRQQQAALARSEAYSKAIVATAAEGIITLDARGRIESVNRAAERMFGYEAQELIGRDINVLMPERHRGKHTGYIRDYVETGQGTICGAGREVPGQRKDGSEFPIYLAASEVVLDGERCFAGIMRDISDQKHAEESRKAVERRFRAVFEQRHQLSGILSVDGRVLEANRKSREFGGDTGETVVGRDYWDLPWWRHSTDMQRRMQDAIGSAASGETVRFEATRPRADGQLATLDFSVRPIRDPDGEIVFLVTESHDITERRAAEEEARQHRARIAHVARLSTLGEMAAGIAHEINQPLTAISLFAQAGRRLVENGDYGRMAEICHKLNEHALRASEVVERMQTMARQGESRKDVVDCNELIETAVKLAESEARIYDIQIEFDQGRDLPPVSVDGVQIQQVALNLLRNGMEATAACDNDARSVVISTRLLDDGQIEVDVSDRGCGVPEDYADKLFTPFSTTKTSGMGMGLSISQAIVRAHGGGIGFRNNDGGGTTFWFTLPALERETHHE
jgi:two-component system sensor kinase FixL